MREQDLAYARKDLEICEAEEKQFQQYAQKVITYADENGRPTHMLKRAAKEGAGGGLGPIFPGKGLCFDISCCDFLHQVCKVFVGVCRWRSTELHDGRRFRNTTSVLPARIHRRCEADDPRQGHLRHAPRFRLQVVLRCSNTAILRPTQYPSQLFYLLVI